MSASLIRSWAASERSSLTSIEHQFGAPLAHRAARRFVYEIAAYVGEVHGKPEALKMLFAAQDAIAVEALIDDGVSLDPPAEVEIAPTVTDCLGSMTNALGEMSDALEHMADAVHLTANPMTWRDAVFEIFERLTWWPLAAIAGVIVGMAIR